MKRFFYFLILLSVCLTPFAYSAEEEQPVLVKAEINRAFMNIGDEIEFKLTITRQPDITLLDIPLKEALSDFQIKKQKDSSSKQDGLIVEEKKATLTSYQLGEYVIRPITITYQDGQGKSQKVETTGLYIAVESIDKNKDPESDIRGIKGVVDVKTRVWPWLLILFAILAVAGGLFAWQKLKKNKLFDFKPKEEYLTPHDEAYRALTQLSHSDFLQKGNYKMYFFKLSEIARRYFERRYRMNALELTTTEVIANLKGKMNSEDLTLARDLLSFCDLVKFAKLTPQPAEILIQNQNAKKLIDRTKENAEPAPDLTKAP